MQNQIEILSSLERTILEILQQIDTLKKPTITIKCLSSGKRLRRLNDIDSVARFLCAMATVYRMVCENSSTTK
ncbi:MAG: hypothetical protein MHPSP_000615, partial [Paramarteilia canceri]